MSASMWLGSQNIGNLELEKSLDQRHILIADLPNAPTNDLVKVVYEGTLSKRRLVAGAPAIPIQPLSLAERESALAATSLCNYDTPTFQSWLDSQNLRQNSSEGVLAFALRALKYMQANFTYKIDRLDATETADYLRKIDHGDCGELVMIYAAILRANDIPCRIKVGKVLSFPISGAPAIDNHVRCDFFLPDIGWIPVGVAESLGGDTKYTFGYDADYHFTMHLDNGVIINTRLFGYQTVQWCQGLMWWRTEYPLKQETVTWQVEVENSTGAVSGGG